MQQHRQLPLAQEGSEQPGNTLQRIGMRWCHAICKMRALLKICQGNLPSCPKQLLEADTQLLVRPHHSA